MCQHLKKKPSDADVIYQRSHTDGNREVSFTNCYYNAAHTRSRWSILYELLLQCAEHTQYVLIPLRTGKYYFTIAIAMSRTHTVRVNTAMYSMMVSIPSLYSAFQRVRVQLHFRCTIRSGQPLITQGATIIRRAVHNSPGCPLYDATQKPKSLGNLNCPHILGVVNPYYTMTS